MPNGCRSGETAAVWGTKAKPSVAAQAPAALLCLNQPIGAAMVMAPVTAIPPTGPAEVRITRWSDDISAAGVRHYRHHH